MTYSVDRKPLAIWSAGDIASETVEQVSAKAAFGASKAVVRAGDDMLK